VAEPKPCDHKFVDSSRCLKCGWEPPAIAPCPFCGGTAAGIDYDCGVICPCGAAGPNLGDVENFEDDDAFERKALGVWNKRSARPLTREEVADLWDAAAEGLHNVALWDELGDPENQNHEHTVRFAELVAARVTGGAP
jgi:hypothetical protein